MWVPVGQLSDQASWKSRGNHPGLYGVARLKPGVAIEQADADMNTIAANLEKQYPDSNTGNRVRLRPLLEIFVVDVRRALWVIFAAVGVAEDDGPAGPRGIEDVHRVGESRGSACGGEPLLVRHAGRQAQSIP